MPMRISAPVNGQLRCPWCGRIETGSATVDLCSPPRPPIAGDVNVCAGCAMILIFIDHPEGLALRRATVADLDDLDTAGKAAIINLVLYTKGKLTQAQYEQSIKN